MNGTQSQADYTTAGLNLIAQALSIYDSNLELVVSNRPFQTMFNLPDALVQRGAGFGDTLRFLALSGEYGPVDDIDDFVRAKVELARAFEPHYTERIRANGRILSVEGSPLPQGGWVSVYTDITRTRRSEQLLRARSEELSDQVLAHSEELSATNRQLASTITTLEETKRQLTEIEARTRMTTEMMPAHIAHVGPDGIYTYSNRRLNSVIPGRPSAITGMHISDALGPDAFSKIAPYLEAAFVGQSSVFEFTEGPSGLRIRVAFTPDTDGGVYILSMDVTAETQARVALQQTRRRTLAAQITSGLAHDFSNLLTIILGAQSRLDRLDLPDDARALSTLIRDAAKRGGRLLDRIADMTGHRTLRPVATDLPVLLDDFKLLANSALPQGLGLSVLDHTDGARALLDPGMLQDALLNLLLNARDACGTSGQITVSAHVVPDVWIVITVGDTGPGFSKDALVQALDPFFTTKGGEGSGLGLPMVYDMVKLAGGDLQLSNTPTGALVTLRLPFRPAPDSGGTLVLLVEDSDPIRAEIRDMLTDLGHSVIEAASVDEAIALTADLPQIGLVLSDINLNGVATGLDLVTRLQDTQMPCVLMTALAPSDPLYAQAAASAPILRKPFDRSQLADLLAPGATP
ncbi:MAG: PAS-domain containing protein [Marinibacterium sp.]|nr:PAS-domain containing protein [Marinibacterium sp.]